ncbi:LpxI family protein [Pelagovum sp. HNIBRBA483]|uniref:LpxI family protein n=1 Tax=Pelagovum sp. HNIBRBA483 TaxID=3233341 RepID=UPI0034A0E522
MLALIAGRGQLPVNVYHQATGAGEEVIVCALDGIDTDLPVDIRFRIEKLGGLLKTLRKRGVTRVCLAGGIDRPKVSLAALDAATLPLLPRVRAALSKGDDGALREVIAILKDKGFEVVAAHDLVPDALPAAGVLAGAAPTPDIESDAAKGAVVAAGLSALDIGQACVIRGGQVVAVEAQPGTDWMLRSLAGGEAVGGILYKAPKSGQDRRADLPVIGPETVRNAIAAQLAAIVIEAGGVMILDLATCRAEADSAGLTIWVRG